MWSCLFQPSDNRTRPCHRHRRLEKQRYYYTNSNLFEQSLDVYKPVHNDNADDSDDCHQQDGLLVVLVVGSAWLGHVPPIYTATSWWNAAGPQAVAQQVGCVTVAIRHRGSFPRIRELLLSLSSCLASSSSSVVGVMGAAMMSAVLLQQSPSFSSIMSLDDSFTAMMELQSTSPISFALVLLALLLLLVVVFVCVWAETQGPPADLEDMLQDVADALQWIERHKKKDDGSSDVLSLTKTTTDDESSSSEKEQSNLVTTTVFGGYSSGGHVAATLLQRPDLLASRGLSLDTNASGGGFCQAVLFLSGVLAVRPLVVADDSHSSHSSRGSWFTNLVTHVVFGPTRAPHLPCPLHKLLLQLRKKKQEEESRNGCENRNHNKSNSTLDDDSGLDYYYPRNLPHLLIGCQDEVFGLGWMNVFFSSAEYCQVLQDEYAIPARWVAVKSNHWNILNSTALRQVLSPQLKWLVGRQVNNNNNNKKIKPTDNDDDNSSDTTRSSSSSSSSSDNNDPDSDDKDDDTPTNNRSILTLTTMTTTSQSSSSSSSSSSN